MKLNRLAAFFSALILFIAYTPNIAFAAGSKNPAGSEKPIIIEHKQIKDINVLYQRAVKGQTDISLSDLPASSTATLKDKYGKIHDKNTKLYKTAQVLRERKNVTGEYIPEEVAVTTIASVDMLAAAAGNQGHYVDSYQNNWKVYSTVIYSVSGLFGTDYELVEVTGGWQLNGTPLVLLSNKVVKYWATYHSAVTKNLSANTNTFDYYTGFTTPVTLCSMYCNISCTFTYQGSSWSFELKNSK